MHWIPINWAGPRVSGKREGACLSFPQSQTEADFRKASLFKTQTRVLRPPALVSKSRSPAQDPGHPSPSIALGGREEEEPQQSPAPVPHSQTPQSPPFPAPAQAPPPSPDWCKAHATLIGQEGGYTNKGPAPVRSLV